VAKISVHDAEPIATLASKPSSRDIAHHNTVVAESLFSIPTNLATRLRCVEVTEREAACVVAAIGLSFFAPAPLLPRLPIPEELHDLGRAVLRLGAAIVLAVLLPLLLVIVDGGLSAHVRASAVSLGRMALASVLGLGATFAWQIADRQRMSADQRARTWNELSWAVALGWSQAPSPMAMLPWMWVTRPPWKRVLLGAGAAAVLLALVQLVDTVIAFVVADPHVDATSIPLVLVLGAVALAAPLAVLEIAARLWRARRWLRVALLAGYVAVVLGVIDSLMILLLPRDAALLVGAFTALFDFAALVVSAGMLRADTTPAPLRHAIAAFLITALAAGWRELRSERSSS
jgi:hypothetical protein